MMAEIRPSTIHNDTARDSCPCASTGIRIRAIPCTISRPSVGLSSPCSGSWPCSSLALLWLLRYGVILWNCTACRQGRLN
jgi:hypothetical protein